MVYLHVWWGASCTPDLDSKLMKLRLQNPALDALGERLYSFESPPVEDEDPFEIDEKERAAFEHIFQFANLAENMPLKQLIDGVPHPDLNRISHLSFSHIYEAFHADQSLLHRFTRDFAAYVERQTGRGNIELDTLPEGSTVENRLEMEYEECAKDYDSFVTPITNPLANLLLPECEEVNEGEPCRNETLPQVQQHVGGRRSEYYARFCPGFIYGLTVSQQIDLWSFVKGSIYRDVLL